MPLFDFLRRGKKASADDGRAEGARAERPRGAGIPFDGLTEEWRLTGRMHIEGRLSDSLNKREAIAISDVQWAPIDGSGVFQPVPGLKSVDPYDLILVHAGEATQPPMTESERLAHKIHKIDYDVSLEVPPFRVIGTVHLHPGAEPERLLDRASEMFVPVTEAVALLGELRVGDPDVDTFLVNRYYLRGVEQIDKRTGEKPQKLPGQPLGGISWQEKSR